MPAPPVLLTICNGCPSSFSFSMISMRAWANTSEPPPGALCTTSSIGLVGWKAKAGAPAARLHATNKASFNERPYACITHPPQVIAAHRRATRSHTQHLSASRAGGPEGWLCKGSAGAGALRTNAFYGQPPRRPRVVSSGPRGSLSPGTEARRPCRVARSAACQPMDAPPVPLPVRASPVIRPRAAGRACAPRRQPLDTSRRHHLHEYHRFPRLTTLTRGALLLEKLIASYTRPGGRG